MGLLLWFQTKLFDWTYQALYWFSFGQLYTRKVVKGILPYIPFVSSFMGSPNKALEQSEDFKCIHHPPNLWHIWERHTQEPFDAQEKTPSKVTFVSMRIAHQESDELISVPIADKQFVTGTTLGPEYVRRSVFPVVLKDLFTVELVDSDINFHFFDPSFEYLYVGTDGFEIRNLRVCPSVEIRNLRVCPSVEIRNLREEPPQK